MGVGGIHDMGGVPGYGPVEPEVDEPVFHHEWEGRVFGLATSVRGGLSRRNLEGLDPDDYMSGYYQRWMMALERGLVDRGTLSAEELDEKIEHFRGNPREAPTRIVDPELTERVRAGVYRQRQAHREPGRPPAFAVGDPVRARRIEHAGHTRLPRYVQGKRGIVGAVYAAYDLPDDTSGGEDAPVQQLYSVRFEGPELWGSSAEPGTALHIDMWEGYLEPVDTSA
jgi:nitrile hydratase